MRNTGRSSGWLRRIGFLVLVVGAPFRTEGVAQQMPAAEELATTVADGFTIATVGDVIVAHSLGHLMSDHGFASVVELLRSADVTTGNLEGHIIDGRTVQASAGGGFGGEPNAAEWLVDAGFDLLQRANNHANDFGTEGVRETSRHLERVGLQYAGTGDTYAAARAARFYTSERGRVGMVAMFGSDEVGLNAAAPGRGEWLGRGGINVLQVNRSFMVPEDRWHMVQTLRDDFPNGTSHYARGANTPEHVGFLGSSFRKAPAGTKEPYYSFEMNPQHFRDVIAAIREGKMRSDFVTVAIHSHHFRDAKGGFRGRGIPEAEHLDTNPSVPHFHEELARAAIDNGADLYQGTGVHALRGIEIYKDRPIFYGLGEFIRQMDVIGLSGMSADGILDRSDCAGCPHPVKYQSVIAISEFDQGRLEEVRLHPVELLDEGVRLAHRGTPRIASPAMAQEILGRLRELSAPYGTEIEIEGNVGYIRP
jgi:Bacterial capsule synthesis protein PGA_cap